MGRTRREEGEKGKGQKERGNDEVEGMG